MDLVEALERVLALLIGPYGVVAVEAAVIFFLWRLFREATVEGKKSQEATTKLTEAVNGLVDEFRQWRESYRDFMLSLVANGDRARSDR